MPSQFSLQRHRSLRDFNTFGIDVAAERFVEVDSLDALKAVFADATLHQLPRLVLGGGSNLLLTRDVPGLVLHVGLKGRRIVGETPDAVLVASAAGENWHDFVLWTLQQGLPGLENLSLIPGSVGGSPIQNVGAYGVEVKDLLHAVTVFDPQRGGLRTLTNADCAFAYRDSVFKHALKYVIVTEVTFALPRRWQPRLGYAELARELQGRGLTAPTASEVSEAVIAIRQRKLPDPSVIGNAGSFFKNPVVTQAQRDALLARHPQLVSYAQPDGSCKLAAGWLIEQTGWKGRRLGNAGVYEKQALVLVNHGGAGGEELRQLAAAVQADVAARFGVRLEPEPIIV